MSKRDYYETLGLSKGASESEIKKGFRKKAMELHPDRNQDDPSAESKFKEANEAYDVLKDADKKAAYDQYGHAAFEGGMGGGGGANGSRAGSTAMGKATWILAIAFIITSIALTIIAAEKSAGSSVVDRLVDAPAPVEGVVTPDLGENLLPPSDSEAPLVPAGE